MYENFLQRGQLQEISPFGSRTCLISLWHIKCSGSNRLNPSCEIIALRQNVDRPESYDSFSAKSCVFLPHSLGYISLIPYRICPKARPMSFTYYSHIITTLQSLTSLCHVTKHLDLEYGKWWVKNASVKLSRLLWTMSDTCKVSDGMRVVVKWLKNILMSSFGAGCLWGWRNIPQTVRVLIYNF
jgi:hypothetical protein